ncbi:hypothetical protein SAMN02745227_01669 [Anaerobranca californiensis DSM 14826]|jgi:hypothetical protein|uniref:Uncharacterized protein n=1 Tax=Anaerobranca californiensis DSM 14826 TaxID=1120989 RepID=A0A1M6Q8J8_9FIRM|nr:hypothetical protein [Anaerobranca californiensis]SHK16572.1 hypothetical protein SAMN02745227_01669 [Anaerobranca californiensis DSM 14826]
MEKRALVTLTVAESKRLIAKGVVKLPQVQKALKEGTIIIAGGTTNGYIVEELTGKKIDKDKYTAGIVVQGRGCVTPPEERIAPVVIEQGEVIDKPWTDVLPGLQKGDVFIKGGNALDLDGNVGVMVAHPQGGTIGAALPILVARGIDLVLPVGLEKLVPSVIMAAKEGGIEKIDYSLGMPCGLVPVSYGQVVTEIQALNTLYSVDVIPYGSGGVGGSEGAQTLLIIGEEGNVKNALEFIKGIKGEPPLKGIKQKCKCGKPCHYFRD